MTRSPERKAERREQILQAAVEVFGRSSFEEGSISEIARRARVSEGTIYQYFKNKQDLFFSIPREKTRAFSAQLDVHLKGIKDAGDKLRKFVWYYLYFFTTNPDYARSLMLEMRVSRAFTRSGSYKGVRRFTNQALEIVKEGQKQGTIREDVDPYLARHVVLGTLEHVVTRWLLRGEREDIIQLHVEISDLLLRGLAMQGGTRGHAARRDAHLRKTRDA